ncbi:MAG: PAS domain S-box protein [Alphaproteobacteria bacterium]|nr:PAS domain S-box protein [Alphaproteobacteria bacterium]MCW5738971.1 PAS domain S-box protein [Alphaproteobacteria bacterium]
MLSTLSVDIDSASDVPGTVLRDAARLEAMRACDLLDTGPEAAFERIVDLAIAMFGVPMAAVSVIDADREWFKARRGFDAVEVPAIGSFGAQTLGDDGTLVALDVRRDHRFRRHPLVAGGPLVRFCAAVGVRAPDGRPVGAVCIMDERPWAALAADRLAGLRALARLVEAELTARQAAERHDELKRRFSDLAKVSSDLVWDTDVEHRFVNFDTEMPGMAPLRPFALGKRRWDFKQSEPIQGSWADHLALLEARQEFRGFEYKLVTSLGEAREMRISGRPVYDRRGVFIGYRGASTDITQQRAHERELAASEARYRNLVDSVVDVVFSTDTAGRFTYASAAATQVLGVRAETLIGRTFASIVDPADHAVLGATLHEARRVPDRLNAVTVRGGGSPDALRHVEVRFTASGEPDAAGHYGFSGIIRDVEAQIVMEARQRDDTMKLRSIVESAGALILLIDRDLRVVLANRTFLAATGDPGRDISGRRFDEVVSSSFDRGILERWLAHEGSQDLAPVEFDSVLPRPQARRRIVRVTASPVQDDIGRVNYILFLGVDETERREAELQLLDAAKLATVGQMATGMAHEINQPLTVLQFAVEGLTGEIEDNVHRDEPEGFAADTLGRLRRMEDQIRRASGIIRSLQGFAHRSDKPAAFDVGQAIVGAVGLVDEQIRLAGIDLLFEPTGALPAIAGHANRLQQVLINLMINARDALNEAGEAERKARGRGRVTLRARHDAAQAQVIVEVADNGSGIPEAVLPRLFEPFFTTKPSGKGTGLGLSISSEIVRKMDGTITVENQPGSGALFRLTFPVAA